MSHSRVLSSVQGLAADVGCTVTLGDPKGPAGGGEVGGQGGGFNEGPLRPTTRQMYGILNVS